MNKVIISGINGFLGFGLAQKLLEKDVKVFGIARCRSNKIDSLERYQNFKLFIVDLSNYDSLPDEISDRGFDVFYHFAWEGTSGCLRSNDEVQINNVKNSIKALRSAEALNCNKFIFASSIMEYEIEKLMGTSKTPNVNSIYSIAKKTANYMLRSIASQLRIKYMSLLISNIYGPGEYSKRLINTSIRKMINNEKCSFSPGEQLYDFVYIDDAVDMFIAIGEYGKENTAYYIGHNEQRKLKEYLMEIRDIVNRDLEIGLGELKFDGVSLDYTEFDTNNVAKNIGIQPRVSFADGIKRTMEWIKNEEF